MRLSEIASRVGAELDGDDIEITGVAAIEHATGREITFLANPAYTTHVKTTRAGAIIVSPEFGPCPLPALRHTNPYLAFARCLETLCERPDPPAGIHPTASIDPSTRIGAGVCIGAHVSIGPNCRIGDGVLIHPNCTVYHDVVIGRSSIVHSNCSIRENSALGDRVILQSGVCIGSDGFGYARQEDGSWYKILQTGRVVIEDDVEIGSNSAVDRPAVGETRLRHGTKIDNLVQVGHSCTIGEHSLLCAQVGLAGSTHVGRSVILAGQVGAAGHLTIGDGVVATAQTGIPDSVAPGQTVSGYPAIDNRQWLKASAIFRKLPAMRETIRQFGVRLDFLEQLHLK